MYHLPDKQTNSLNLFPNLIYKYVQQVRGLLKYRINFKDIENDFLYEIVSI